MKKEVKLLLQKSLESLLLCIEMFNRPSEVGRVDHAIMILDHAYEMFLKAAILHRGGKIREKRATQTVGFDACVRKALSDASVKFLTEEQAMTIQTINGYRDAAQHHLLMLSEQMLYVATQAGVSLYRILLRDVFNQELRDHLPERVLPVSTLAPTDLQTLFDSEIEEVRKLLKPGSRRLMEARMRLRPLAILEGSLAGSYVQPSKSELERLCAELRKQKAWETAFPGIASINLTASGAGPSLDLRITKKGGEPVTIVPAGTPGAAVVAVRKIKETEFYNMQLKQLAAKVGLSSSKTLAVVNRLDLQSNEDFFKAFPMGTQIHKRYSHLAIAAIKDCLAHESIDDIWKNHKPGRKPVSKN